MKIEIPWELYLKSAEENRKIVEGRILEACRRWPTSEYVEVLQDKLNLYREEQTNILKNEIENMTKKILPEIREQDRINRHGFALNPSVKYPSNREIIFIKPGKEAYDVKDNGKYEIYNPDDMLPLVLRNNEEIKLSTQKNRDATMGELARELAKIKRVNPEIFGEVCALLVRMSMYYENDHERLPEGGYAWSPDRNTRNRIYQLNLEIASVSDVDLWNFLLTCHAISLQEDVKYNKDFCKRRGIKTSKIGRYTHLSSMILWGDLLGSTNDSGIAVHASKFDSVLVHNAVITINLKEVREIFKDYMAECSKETKMLLDLEAMKVDEIKKICEFYGIKKTGKKSELIQKIIPYYGTDVTDIYGNIKRFEKN